VIQRSRRWLPPQGLADHKRGCREYIPYISRGGGTSFDTKEGREKRLAYLVGYRIIPRRGKKEKISKGKSHTQEGGSYGSLVGKKDGEERVG